MTSPGFATGPARLGTSYLHQNPQEIKGNVSFIGPNQTDNSHEHSEAPEAPGKAQKT